MAVTGKKTFQQFDILTASDTNAYLVNDSTPNVIINGGFDFWQRGTSFTNPSSLSFVADRWKYVFDGTGATRVFSQQTFTPGSGPGNESQYYFRFAQSVAGSGGTYSVLQQPIEDVRTFAGQTVTLSFYAKADAARTLGVSFDRGYGSGGSSTEYSLYGNTFSLTTSWARYTATVDIASLSGKTVGAGSYLMFNFSFAVNTAQTIDIWGVQLERGTGASPFRRAGGTMQGELAACQRYFQVIGTGFVGRALSATVAQVAGIFAVPMRSAPAITLSANQSFVEMNVSGRTATAISSYTAQSNGTSISLTSSSLTSPNMVLIDSASTIWASSEF